MDRDSNSSVKFQDSAADRHMAEAASLWSYLPQLLRYPVRGYALGVLVVLGALLALTFQAGVFGLAMLALLACWLCFYALEVVGDTASGHALPPPLGTEVFSEFDFGSIGLLLAYLVFLEMVPAYFAVFHHQSAARWLAIVMLFFLPAFIALLAMEDRFWQALNPVKLVLFIWRTGFAYLMICAVMIPALAIAIVLGRHLVSALAYMLLLYCLILACHTLGFVAYHRQDQLGLSVATDKPTQETRQAEARQAALNRLLQNIDRLAAQNHAHAAAVLVLAPAVTPLQARVFHEQLFEALRARRHMALALLAGAKLMEVLLEEMRRERALDIYEQCLDIAWRFEPRRLADGVPLAETALQIRRFGLFEKIVAGISARHPGTDITISLQFLSARYLAEIRKDDAAALAALQPLLAAQAHPWHTRITALHRVLDNSSLMS